MVDLSFTFMARKVMTDFKTGLFETQGFDFNFKTVYYNFRKGFVLKGAEFGKGGNVFFSAARIEMGLDTASLLRGKITANRINVFSTCISLKDSAEIESFFKSLYSENFPELEFSETVYYKLMDAWLGGVVSFDAKGYFSWLRNSLFVSKGELLIKKIQIPALPAIDPFRGSNFYDTFDYVFEAEKEENDFVVTHIDLSNKSLNFTGVGKIKNYKDDPYVELSINLSNIILDNFPAFNEEYVMSRGIVDSVLDVKGPVTDIKSTLTANVANAAFVFSDSLFLDGVNGLIVITPDKVEGKNFIFNVNGMSCSASFNAHQQDYPHIELQMYSDRKIKEKPAYALSLSADWMEDSLTGDLTFSARHMTQDAVGIVNLKLGDFQLGYKSEFFINVADAGLKLHVGPVDESSDSGFFDEEINLSQLFCKASPQKGGFILEGIKSYCYDGTLEGEAEISSGQGKSGFSGEFHAKDVNLDRFKEQTKRSKDILVGRLDADFKFNSGSDEQLKGQIFIKDGVIEQNPLLNAVADFLGVASLKKISFDDLSIFFNGGKGDYSSKIKLTSSEVNALLDGNIKSYEKMDGYLSVSMSTKKLNESSQFRKILKYIRHDEPYVVFPFKISSYINSPRVLWLKNEFKEKLEGLLPQRNQRYLQKHVNKMVEDVEDNGKK